MVSYWGADPVPVLNLDARIGLDVQLDDGTIVSGRTTMGQILQLYADHLSLASGGSGGTAGRGIASLVVNTAGHLMVTFTDSATPVDLGRVVGLDGLDGQNGVSITGASIDPNGHLMLALSTGGSVDAGALPSTSGGAVVSVAGRTGSIVLTAADIGGLAAAIAAAAPVASVAGRTGAVTLAVGDVAGAAPLASPALSGMPTAPTGAVGANTNQIATMAAIKAAIDALIGTAPGTYDTLGEIAAQMASDETGLAALTTVVAGKQAALTIRDEGAPLAAAGGIAILDFVGGGVTVALTGGGATVTIPAAPVSSVAGKGGAVVLAVADVANAADTRGQRFTGRVSIAPVPLTDTATIATDASLGNEFRVTLAGNRSLALPVNLLDGQRGEHVIAQDSTGGRTLSFASGWKFPGGAVPTLSTAAGARDRLTWAANADGTVDAVLSKAFA